MPILPRRSREIPGPVHPETAAAKQRQEAKGLAWWGPWTGVGLLLLLLIVPEIVAAPLAFLAQTLAQGKAGNYQVFLDWLSTTTGNTWYVALNDLVVLTIVGLVAYFKRQTLSGLGLNRLRWKHLGVAALLSVAYLVSYLAIVLLVSYFVPGFDAEQERNIGFNNLSGMRQLATTFILLVIITPIVEEIMFRGFLFRGLRKKMPFWVATILTSAVFGVAHLSSLGSGGPVWVAALDTFVLSIALCAAREYSKSLWPAIYMHAAKNTLAFVFLYVVH